MVNSRSLTAETISHTAWEDENTDEASMAWDQSGQYLNFSNQEAKLVSLYQTSNCIFETYASRKTEN